MNVNKNPIKLTILRMEKGLTRQQLADRVDIDTRAIEKWEQRKVRVADVPVGKILRVARVLNCSIEDLIDD